MDFSFLMFSVIPDFPKYLHFLIEKFIQILKGPKKKKLENIIFPNPQTRFLFIILYDFCL